MTVAVDTNILLDILLPDVTYRDTSFRLLIKYIEKNKLIISEIVYCELASQFSGEDLVRNFLNDVGITLVPSTHESLWIAAKAWKEYTKTRNKTLQCAVCGEKMLVSCLRCKSTITCRQCIISDFLIAGHAIVEAGILLTRDRGFYKTYFSELKTESGIPSTLK